MYTFLMHMYIFNFQFEKENIYDAIILLLRIY